MAGTAATGGAGSATPVAGGWASGRAAAGTGRSTCVTTRAAGGAFGGGAAGTTATWRTVWTAGAGAAAAATGRGGTTGAGAAPMGARGAGWTGAGVASGSRQVAPTPATQVGVSRQTGSTQTPASETPSRRPRPTGAAASARWNGGATRESWRAISAM